MLDERQLKSLRSFAMTILIMVYVSTIILVIRHLGYNINFLQEVTIERSNDFFLFMLIPISIGGIFNNPRNLSEDKVIIVREKIRPLMLGNIIFISYILFSIFIIKEVDFIIASIIIQAMYINVILISRGLYSYALSDRQRQWQEAVNGTCNSIQDSNILWRYKIWFRPLQKVPFNKRYLRSYNVILCLVGITLLFNKIKFTIVTLIFVVIYIKSFLAILEYLLGIYTSLTGVCTGIGEFQENLDRNRGGDEGLEIRFRSRRRRYWVVYITDFKNKREIVYKTYKMPFISEGDDVKVIHGVFSKEVISINGFKMDDDIWTAHIE